MTHPTRACIKPKLSFFREKKPISKIFYHVSVDVDRALASQAAYISLAEFASCIMKERPSAMDLKSIIDCKHEIGCSVLDMLCYAIRYDML